MMRPPRSAIRAARVTIAIVFLGAGCEILVDGKIQDVRCQDEGAFGPPACPAGFACTGGMCLSSALGAACRTDADCGSSDLCLDPATFGGDGVPRCSRACCTSNDCDPDRRFVCWIAPHGAGSFCRAAPDIGRAEGGLEKAGAACARGADCRSGLCGAGRCADTCCSDTSCVAHGGVCRFGPGPLDEPAGFRCAAPEPMRKARYAPCEAHDECASGLCIPLDPDPTPRCSVPCCDSSTCEVSPSKGTPVACAPIIVDGVWVRACSRLVAGLAAGAVGSACSDDGDCRSGSCDETQRCSDGCCSDASCGDPSSFVCRPVGEPSSWVLRCRLK